MIFILVDEIIIIYIQLNLINLWGFKFKSLLKEILEDSSILVMRKKQSYLKYCFEVLLKIICALLRGLEGGQTRTKIWESRV